MNWLQDAIHHLPCFTLLALFTFTASPKAPAQSGDDLFNAPRVHHIWLTIAEAQMQELRTQPRAHVAAEISDGMHRLTNADVHLKGSVGSFRSLDSKPSFTISFDHSGTKQSFHGLTKIHLNNSVEDGSYLNEAIGAELFRAAGVPAPRVGHALVMLNGRALGLYVLKEGFTREFLARYYTTASGRLYEPGEGHDIGEPLDCKFDGGGKHGSALDLLASAIREPNLKRRWQKLEESLDVSEFITFMAMEALLAHRDGYCLARNNFRVYEDSSSGCIAFLPHGMDQLFGIAPNELLPHMSGRVAQAVLETEKGLSAYRQRAGTLFTNLFVVTNLHQRIDTIARVLKAQLPSGERDSFAKEITDLKQRVRDRHRLLEKIFSEGQRTPILFSDAPITLTNWQQIDVLRGVTLDVVKHGGRQALHIKATANSGAAWQATVLLAPGRYRFEGTAKTEGVRALSFGQNHGAALRQGSERSEQITGDAEWTPLSVEFTVASQKSVQLFCELRACAGQVWFSVDELRLRKLPWQKASQSH